MGIRIRIFASLVAAGGLLVSFQNCSKTGFGTDSAIAASLLAEYGGPAICDPLSGGKGDATSSQNGLVGKLFYESAADVAQFGAPTTIEKLLEHASIANATLFMSQVDVPTRRFTEGFSADGSSALDDPTTGKKLVEYFGISMESVLKLAAGDGPGYYQFATISDDGSVLSATIDGQRVPIAGISSIHSTTSYCGSSAIYLDAKSALAINFLYSQGPADAISAVLAWRKVASATPAVGPECGVQNGWNFFVPATNETTPWQNMQAAGWNVIPAKNFFLPSNAPANTCN